MRVFVNPIQPQTTSVVRRNLLKNTRFSPIQQRSASAMPLSPNLQVMRVNKMDVIAGNVPNLAKDAAHVGPRYDVSKRDAQARLNALRYTMDDTVAPEDVVSLYDQEKGFSFEEDLFYLQIDLYGFQSDQIAQNVDYIASRYVAMKDRIDTEFTGDEKITNLKKLEEAINTAASNFAQSFSEEMGSFLKEYGVSNDQENIYKSILSAIRESTVKYTDFIKSNGNNANINGPEEQWLRNDSAYMASELRKAMAAVDQTSSGKAEQRAEEYTLDELEKLYCFSKELQSYAASAGSSSEKSLRAGNNSEESLGIRLAELMLKGKVFNDQADVSDKVKNIVSKSIDNFISSAIDAEQAFMDYWSKLQIQAANKSLSEGAYTERTAKMAIEKIQKNHTAIDKDAIYAVIHKVAAVYEASGNASKALIEGAIFAKDQFECKVQSNQYQGIYRYDMQIGWNGFFTRTSTSESEISAPERQKAVNHYAGRKSKLDALVGAWNDFMRKITTSPNAFLTQSNYSSSV